MTIGRSICLASAVLAALTLASSNISQVPPSHVVIEVDASKPSGPLPRIWSYFGYDEPNFTYSANGKKLLRELKELCPAPTYLRAHNLLTSGDGTGSL